jgi:two-component system, cell cycle sensor histidine kinase and response regulator CckA
LRFDLRDTGRAPKDDRNELRQSVAELTLIVDAMPALVLYKDLDNRIRRVNRAVADALGVPADELSGTELGRWIGADAAARHQAELDVTRSGRAQLGVIEQMELPGSGKRWFETARLPQRDAAGQVVGLVVVSRDITEQKQLESRLLQAHKLDSIGKLAGGVAHDFNNLLTSFFGLITAAQRALPTESMAHEYLSLMQLAVEGGANFTRQLLAFARRQLIEPRVVDLNRLVRETSALLSRVLGAHIRIDMQLGVDSVPVRVDPSQVSQLLMNLALNARDAMSEQGTLTFETSSVELHEPSRWSLAPSSSGRYALLLVSDTGEGLSEEAKEHLFEPFFTSKALGHGTGLGLATCYGIVKQNGGHIAVESERGQGTTFRIYLPEVDAEIEPARPDRRQAPARAGNETLLFAEDDDLVRYLSVAALASSGYRLIDAADGAEALLATEEHAGPIHLLVTDVSMPQVGGVEVARRFRELRPDAAVLFISGYASDLLAELGPDVDVLQKPFSTDELLARVREVLDALPASKRAPG